MIEVRGLTKRYGDTVLVSSHLMSEMQQTADHLLVIGRGRLIADASVEDVLARSGGRSVRVRTDDAEALVRCVQPLQAEVERLEDGALLVTGVSAADIGQAVRDAGLVVHELTEVANSLEQAYMELTASSVEYAASVAEPEEIR